MIAILSNSIINKEKSLLMYVKYLNKTMQTRSQIKIYRIYITLELRKIFTLYYGIFIDKICPTLFLIEQILLCIYSIFSYI